MTVLGLVFIVIFFGSGLIWIVSGRDPLWIAARACMVLRAAFIQVGRSFRVFLAHFRAEYVSTLKETYEAIRVPE